MLEAAGWRFFAQGAVPANIRLEPGVTLKHTDLDALGNDFETASRGFVDFLLLDARGFPLLVLEAKADCFRCRTASCSDSESKRGQNPPSHLSPPSKP